MAKKKVPTKRSVVYADADTPVIEFADFVRLSISSHGVLFEFGQNQPFGSKTEVTHQIIVPHDVAGRLHEILGTQMEQFNQMVAKTFEDMQEQD